MSRAHLTIVAVTIFALACFDSHSTKVEGETNWLRICENGADCGDGLTCICGVCTRSCESDRECGDLPADPECVSFERFEDSVDCRVVNDDYNAVCDMVCTEDSDCWELDDDAVCRSGSCRKSVPLRPINSASQDAGISIDLDASDDSASDTIDAAN